MNTRRVSYIAVVVSFQLLLHMSAPAANPPQFPVAKQAANPGVIPPSANPNPSSYGEMGVKFWQWALAIPFSQNPILDPTGADCAVNQSGPVWFLAGAGGSLYGQPVIRHCTIPEDVKIFLPIVNNENDYPCPDPNFQPAPHQSLRDFLINGDPSHNIPGPSQFFDSVDTVKVSVDGTELQNVRDYRATSSLFQFTGDLSLSGPQFDPCITGLKQQATSDGYWLMLAPLSPGPHTIHFFASISGSTLQDVTYFLTVAGSRH